MKLLIKKQRLLELEIRQSCSTNVRTNEPVQQTGYDAYILHVSVQMIEQVDDLVAIETFPTCI